MNKVELAKDISDLLGHLYDAHIKKSMGGVGGYKHFDMQSFPEKYQRYIHYYLYTDYSSAQATIDYLFHNGYLDHRIIA